MNGREYDEMAYQLEADLRSKTKILQWHVLKIDELVNGGDLSIEQAFGGFIIASHIIVNGRKYKTEMRYTMREALDCKVFPEIVAMEAVGTYSDMMLRKGKYAE